jgi:hypothetical protein
MAANQLTVLDAQQADTDDSQVFDHIGNQILQALGAPTRLRSVNVRRLWEHHYRANVIVGENAIASTVAHSYFVVSDSTGRIVTSNPTIQRQYQ